jgi:20S proteasome alpha/beta subunit
MTIAAGFVHKDGVLLCSDTQQEGGAIKIHSPKIGVFNCPGGKLGFALAGNVRFAISTIQTCAQQLRQTEASNTISVLEAVLDREYRRLVYQHPDYGKDESIPYWLLISFWSSQSNTTSLFMTEGHALVSSFESFQAIGSGFELATVLARPFIYDEMKEEESLILAAYVLARVKDNVPGCGGDSQFVSMKNGL